MIQKMDTTSHISLPDEPVEQEDLLDGFLAEKAKRDGFASHEEIEAFLDSIKNATEESK